MKNVEEGIQFLHGTATIWSVISSGWLVMSDFCSAVQESRCTRLGSIDTKRRQLISSKTALELRQYTVYGIMICHKAFTCQFETFGLAVFMFSQILNSPFRQRSAWRQTKGCLVLRANILMFV